MGVANRVVGWVLQSPMHRLLSGSVALVRYTGRRSGRTITTPVQYAEVGDDGDVVVVVGRPDTKAWWRNFGHDRALEVLVRREWQPMTGRAVVGADEPDTMAPLLDAYLARFPKAAKVLAGDTRAEQVRDAVAVHCRPR